MNATAVARISESRVGAGASIVGVDLAKNVFQLAVADATWRMRESHRLSRHQFERFFVNRDVALVVMEACDSVHHWARWLNALGIEVVLLPARYVRAYVRRNKTDAADATALLKAAQDRDIKPVRVKSVEQQALQALLRTRCLWKDDRTRRINTLRGLCREFGIAIAKGARPGVEQIAPAWSPSRTRRCRRCCARRWRCWSRRFACSKRAWRSSSASSATWCAPRGTVRPMRRTDAHSARHSLMQCAARAVTQFGHCGSKARPNFGLTRKPALSNMEGSLSRTKDSSATNGTATVPRFNTAACAVISSNLPQSWKRNTTSS